MHFMPDTSAWLEEQLPGWYQGPEEFAFAAVIRAISGFRVEPFMPDECEEDAALLAALARAASRATEEAAREGILVGRRNEVSGKMEEYLVRAILAEGIAACTPHTQQGNRKARGYPDIELTEETGRNTYIELKTFQAQTVGQTQRTFYVSVPPTRCQCKVAHDARHLLVCFRIEPTMRNGRDCFQPVAWGIRDAANLRVRLKHEFNAANRGIYEEDEILAKEGILWGQPRQLSLEEVE